MALSRRQHRFKSGWGRQFSSERDIGFSRCPFSILSPAQDIPHSMRDNTGSNPVGAPFFD